MNSTDGERLTRLVEGVLLEEWHLDDPRLSRGKAMGALRQAEGADTSLAKAALLSLLERDDLRARILGAYELFRFARDHDVTFEEPDVIPICSALARPIDSQTGERTLMYLQSILFLSGLSKRMPTPFVEVALSHPNDSVRRRLGGHLIEVTTGFDDRLFTLFDDPSHEVRYNATRALAGRLKGPDRIRADAAKERMLALLDHSDLAYVASWAAYDLLADEVFGPHNADAIVSRLLARESADSNVAAALVLCSPTQGWRHLSTTTAARAVDVLEAVIVHPARMPTFDGADEEAVRGRVAKTQKEALEILRTVAPTVCLRVARMLTARGDVTEVGVLARSLIDSLVEK